MTTNGLLVKKVLSLRDDDAKTLGLHRLDEDRLILEFARWAEANLKRWVDYPQGALLFLTVPGQPESGMFHIYDRSSRSFFMVDPGEVDRYGGYREDEFEQMAQAYGLKALAQNPRQLRTRLN